MSKLKGIFLILLAVLLAVYGVLHLLGTLSSFSTRLEDPNYSAFRLYARFLAPLLAFLLAYRAGKAGVRGISAES
ncbi:MAG: hypothetical protein AAGH76_14910 [Pseudomonadota bacterium]